MNTQHLFRARRQRLLAAIGSSSVSADESVPVPTTTTVVEQFDEESGLIWSQVDDHTIEISFPD